MKRWVQTEDRTKLMAFETYKFKHDVETYDGIKNYVPVNPPMDAMKFDSVTKKFKTLMPADLKKAFDAFELDKKKPILLRKWAIIKEWTQYESPADDGLPPWPGPFNP